MVLENFVVENSSFAHRNRRKEDDGMVHLKAVNVDRMQSAVADNCNMVLDSWKVWVTYNDSLEWQSNHSVVDRHRAKNASYAKWERVK